MASNEVGTTSIAITDQPWCWLYVGAFVALGAAVLFRFEKKTLALVLLTLAAFGLRLIMTSTDPFLYDWDEQYHALVAQHMIAHPGTPTLYDDPQLPVDITQWAHNHIWLHKPPLFLWLIAISIKIFGATPFAVKLPSVILSALMVPALYSLVKRITNPSAGFLAAMMLALHSYSIQLVSGFRNTDHNDVIFSAFVLFTFWSWIRYTDSGKRRDAILTGALVGCAVLVKWLPGIFVFAPWGLWMLQKNNRADKTKWIHLGIAVLAAVILVVPWQYHIYKNFPAEAAYESYYNWMHLKIPMEGHEGPWYFHFQQLEELLGLALAILVAPGILLLAIQDTKQKRALFIVIACVLFFAFYSFVPTKMPLFILPVIPFLLAGVAVGLDKANSIVLKRKSIMLPVIGIAGVFAIVTVNIVANHSSLSELAWYRDELQGVKNKAELYVKQKQESGEMRRGVIFNFPENERAAFMFYTGDIAYTETPSLDSVHAIQQKGFLVGVYDVQTEAYKNDPTIRRWFSHLNP